MKINSKAEIRMEVEKLRSDFKDEEIFESPFFSDLMYATIESVCNSYGRLPELICGCWPNADLTACTNYNEIRLNTLGPLIRDLPSNWKKYVANIGHVVHECGHVLYTDFIAGNNQAEFWNTGNTVSLITYLPDLPETKDFCKELVSKPKTRRVYCMAMLSIRNVIEDAYIEQRLREDFDGLAVVGLQIVNEEMYSKFMGLNYILEQAEEGKMLPIQVLDQILLTILVCKQNDLQLYEEKLTEDQAKILDEVEKARITIEPIVEQLVSTTKKVDRTELYNQLFIKLFSLMPNLDIKVPEMSGFSNDDQDEENSNSDNAERKESKSKSSSSSESGEENLSGERDKYSDEDIDRMVDKMEDDKKASGRSSDAFGATSPVESEVKSEEETKSKEEHAKELCNSSSSMERELQNAIKQALTEKVIDDFVHKQEKELRRESKQIEEKLKALNKVCAVGPFPFQSYKVIRNNASAVTRKNYERDYKDVSSRSKSLVRKINNILEDREEDSFEGGLLMGQKFNAKDVVNRDGKYFSREIVPDGKPKLVFGLLIDESGSMSNYCTRHLSNADRARKVAILFEDVLRNLGIPQIVVGHTENNGGQVIIKSYVDFDTKDERDRYRLADIHAESGNIDGAAIGYIGEKLAKRPEETKVLVVISDGEPAGTSFWDGKSEINDTVMAIKHYRKKGIKVFGAVVDCWENVSRLYGEDFSFDCREEKALEQQFIKLIKRFVLAK